MFAGAGTSSPMELVVTKYDHESRTTANPSLFDPFKAMWPSIYNTNNYTVPKGWKQVWDDDEHFHFENLSTHEVRVDKAILCCRSDITF